MPNQKVILVVCLLLISSSLSFAQKQYIFGKALDKETQRPLASATVVNKTSKQITKTNDKGDFFLWVMKGDSIKITSVGYKDKTALWDGTKEPVIMLKQEAIMLGEVVVRERRAENLKKEIEDFVNNPYGSKEMRKEILRNMLNTNTSQPGIGISIDAIYDMFSKEGKSRRKLADLEQKDLKKFYVELRYNAQLAGYITKLKGDDLVRCMKFCALGDDFVIQASDYDLTYQIYRCYEEFKR